MNNILQAKTRNMYAIIALPHMDHLHSSKGWIYYYQQSHKTKQS